MREIIIKICGLTDPYNIAEIVALKPHFMGLILYAGSPRYVSFKEAENLVKDIPQSIKKVGVLVNEPFENALEIARSGVFDLLQLHGNESHEYCRKLADTIGIIKAFAISDSLPENLYEYQAFCKMFLFDKAGEKHGGTGLMFDHRILSYYSLETMYLLSGGISPSDSGYIKSMCHAGMAGVDLNSRFEVKPGIKDISLLRYFLDKLRENDILD